MRRPASRSLRLQPLVRNAHLHLALARLDRNDERQHPAIDDGGDDPDEDKEAKEGRHGFRFVRAPVYSPPSRRARREARLTAEPAEAHSDAMEPRGERASTMDGRPAPAEQAGEIERVLTRLGTRSIVLVGMMGAGKTSIGRRLATLLQLPFVDADVEIEKAANQTIPEIFEHYGEAHFRAGEERVMARLLGGGPSVIATGGGAFMSPETRARCHTAGVSVWLRADVGVLAERVRKKGNRPLLNGGDPEERLRAILDVREPVYAQADITVASREAPHQVVLAEIIHGLDRFLDAAPVPAAIPEPS